MAAEVPATHNAPPTTTAPATTAASCPKKGRVAVVGAGIAGLSTAWALARSGEWDVTVLEREPRLGGHSLTVDTGAPASRANPRVDLGFQVMNLTTYPYFTAMLRELGVDTEPSDMSFSLSVDGGRLEWGSRGLNSLLGQRSNAASPRFWRMLRDVLRFGTQCLEVLTDQWAEEQSPQMTLGEYVKLRKYSDVFVTDYITAMTAAVWSCPRAGALDYPIVPLVRFWDNHHLLTVVGDRPQWRVVSQRSEEYVAAIEAFLLSRGAAILTGARVEAVDEAGPGDDGVSIRFRVDAPAATASAPETRSFDHVVFATHAPTTLGLLATAQAPLVPAGELELLGQVKYQANDVYLHQDEAQMPRNRRCWCAWNVLQGSTDASFAADITVTYWLNLLQNLDEAAPLLLCTLNPTTPIPADRVLAHRVLEHPVYNPAMIDAQQQLNRAQAAATPAGRRVWFAGAWLGSGFHEDGMRSGMAVAHALGAAPPFVACPQPGLQLVRGPSPTLTAADRVAIHLFDAVAQQFAADCHFRVVLPSGAELGPFGHRTAAEAVALGQPAVVVWVHDMRMLHLTLAQSDIGLGEAYMAGLFDVDNLDSGAGAGAKEATPGIVAFCHILAGMLEPFAETVARPVWEAPSVTLAVASLVVKAGDWVDALQHQLRQNTLGGSRRNIEEHYDLGNDMYERFLDPTMTYSSGIHTRECGADEFGPPQAAGAAEELPLHEAQLAKLDAIIARCGVRAGDHVLEVGCGWGSFAIRAATTTGCRVTGVTISKEQLALAEARVAKLGLSHLITFLLCDYRQMGRDGYQDEATPEALRRPASFDRVVSIEMLEAVGHENLPEYFAAVDRMLRPGGVALIQVIAIPNSRYENYMRTSDFIRHFIFPGGHLPCLNALDWATQDTALTLDAVDDIGPDYAITLRHWRTRFMDQQDHMRRDLGLPTRFIKMWEFYFAYCEVGFERRLIQDYHLRYSKAEGGEKPQAATAATAATAAAERESESGASAAASGSDTASTVAGLGSAAALPALEHVASWDTTTKVCFALWIALCSAALLRVGSSLLLLPVVALAVFLGHLAAGSLSVRTRTRHDRWVAMETVSMVAWSALGAVLALHAPALLREVYEGGFISQELEDVARESASGRVVLSGLGIFVAEVLVILAGRVSRDSNGDRWRYLLTALTCIGFAALLGLGLPQLALFFAAEVATVPYSARHLLNARGYTFKSPLYRAVWGLAVAGVLALRLIPHIAITAQIARSENQRSYLINGVSPAAAAMLGMAVCLLYDLNHMLCMGITLLVDIRDKKVGTKRKRAELVQAVLA